MGLNDSLFFSSTLFFAASRPLPFAPFRPLIVFVVSEISDFRFREKHVLEFIHRMCQNPKSGSCSSSSSTITSHLSHRKLLLSAWNCFLLPRFIYVIRCVYTFIIYFFYSSQRFEKWGLGERHNFYSSSSPVHHLVLRRLVVWMLFAIVAIQLSLKLLFFEYKRTFVVIVQRGGGSKCWEIFRRNERRTDSAARNLFSLHKGYETKHTHTHTSAHP